MTKIRQSKPLIWKTQKPIDYIDTTLTINTFETVSTDLSEGKPCQLDVIKVEQTNNGATAETILLEITINGTPYEFTASLNDGTIYYGHFLDTLTTGDFTPDLTVTAVNAGAINPYEAIPITADSVGLIRVKQTTTVDGTAAQIEVNIIWKKLE